MTTANRKKQHLEEKGFTFSEPVQDSGKWTVVCTHPEFQEFRGSGSTESEAISSASKKTNEYLKNNMMDPKMPMRFLKPIRDLSTICSILVYRLHKESPELNQQLKLILQYLTDNNLYDAKLTVFNNLEQIKQYPEIYAIVQKYNLSLSAAQISKLSSGIKIL